MERNRRNRNKEKSLKEQVPKRSYRSVPQGRDEDALIMSDELGLDVASEFPGLKVGDENVLVREEEEVVEYRLEPFRKAADPVGIYLKEMGSFPLLTREGEVEIAKRIESGQQEVLSVVINCPIAVREVISLGGALRAGKTEIKEVTNEIDDEETNVEEEQIQKKRVLNLTNKFGGRKQHSNLQRKLRCRKKDLLKRRFKSRFGRKRLRYLMLLNSST